MTRTGWGAVCSKGGCNRRTFMDTDRCFDHQAGPGIGFRLWFGFCALVSLAVAGVIIWAVIELVKWVTTK